MLARIFLALTLAAAAGFAADEAAALEFAFTGQCDDCAFDGSPSDIDFDPFDDGLFQPVTGTLVLENVTPGPGGVIDVGSESFVSFSYAGSSLLNPFTFTDPFTIRGMLSATGEVLPGEELHIETSAGDFSSFCTPLGVDVLEADGIFCDSIGFAIFDLDSFGSWTMSGSELFDVGVGGGLAVVPEPVVGGMLGLGLLGAGLSRRRRRSGR